MPGVDKAAEAFESDINGTSARANSEDSGDVEVMFDREHEDDEVAGGDSMSDPEPKRSRRARDEEDDPNEDDDPEEDDDSEENDPNEDDDPEEDDDSEEDDDEDEEFDSEEFEVTIDGETATVTGKEMKAGYIRQETFHRRLNKLAEAQELITAEARKVVENRNTYAKKLQEAEELLNELVPQEPDWDTLYETDPAKAKQLRQQYKLLSEKREDLVRRRKEAEDEAREESSKQFRDWAASEKRKFLSSNPHWEDEKVMQREIESMHRTARSVGFDEETILNTHDSRMLKILQKAAAYDRLTAKKPKLKRKGKQPVNNHGAGRGSSRTAPKGRNRASQRLSRTGSVQDAADVFGEFLRNT